MKTREELEKELRQIWIDHWSVESPGSISPIIQSIIDYFEKLGFPVRYTKVSPDAPDVIFDQESG